MASSPSRLCILEINSPSLQHPPTHNPQLQHYKARQRPLHSILPATTQIRMFARTLSRTASRTPQTFNTTQQQAQFVRKFSQTTAKMGVHNVANKAEFEAALKDHKVVVLDAFATWCGPCKVIAPTVVKYVFPSYLLAISFPFTFLLVVMVADSRKQVLGGIPQCTLHQDRRRRGPRRSPGPGHPRYADVPGVQGRREGPGGRGCEPEGVGGGG